MIDLLLPLSRFEVNYEVASGRPYADLDRLVLQAVAEKIRDLDALVDSFQLQPRLIIEVLISLARAGWLSFDIGKGTFEVTTLGRNSLKEGVLPPYTVIESASEVVLLEEWTGAIVSQKEISYTNKFALEKSGVWATARRLPTCIIDDRLDHGEVIGLLRQDENQWIRSVETPVLCARGRHWLRARVDVSRGLVYDIPDRWQKALGPLLLHYAAGITGEPLPPLLQSAEPLEPAPLLEADVRATDILVTHAQHIDALRAAFAEAQSLVVVGSAFLDSDMLEGEARQWMLDALRRRVQIDLLWGYGLGRGEGAEKKTLKWLRRLREEAGTGVNLRFSSEPTESHAKFLIADRNHELEAIIGSFNWLSTPLTSHIADRAGSNVSIRLRHPALLAELLHSAAALWMSSRAGLLSDAPERLRNLAGKCARKAAESNPAAGAPGVRIGIIRDTQHEHWLRQIMQGSDTPKMIVSHQLGRAARSRLQFSPNPSYKELSILFGRPSDTMDASALNEVTATVAAGGGRCQRADWVHSKVAMAGDTVLISSYNFLSADPFQTARRAREVGVVLQGAAVAELIRSVFNPIVSHQTERA